MIYTSYFAKLRTIPNHIIPIAICATVPKWYDGLHDKTLAPSYNTLMTYKSDNDWSQYIKAYNNEILSKINPNKIVNQLYNLAGAKDIVLLCYEKPSDYCHRQLVSEWLNEHNIPCQEWNGIEKINNNKIEENIELDLS